MNVKAFSILILSLLYLAVVLCGNPVTKVEWNSNSSCFCIEYKVGEETKYTAIRDGTIDFHENQDKLTYSKSDKILTATENGVEYRIKFDFETGVPTGDLPRTLRTKILMGSGISVTAVVIIGALYYFLSGPAQTERPSPIDAAKEKKAKLPKKNSKNGKLTKKGKA